MCVEFCLTERIIKGNQRDYRPKNSAYNYKRMKSTSEVLVSTEDSINYRDNFARFLTESERSAYTIKNYLCDLDGFALWLKSKGNREFAPELITPTDLREYQGQRILK